MKLMSNKGRTSLPFVLAIIFFIIAALLCAVIICILIFRNNIEQSSFLSNVESGKYEKAIKLYTESGIEDSEVEDAALKIAEKSVGEYQLETTTYEDTVACLDCLKQTALSDNQELDSYLSTTETIYNSRQAYNKAVDHMNYGETYEALVEYMKVSELDEIYYPLAQGELRKQVGRYKDSALSEANRLIYSGEYDKAKKLLDDLVVIYRDEDVDQAIENLNAGYREAEIDALIVEIEASFYTNDLNAYIDVCGQFDEALNLYPNNEKLIQRRSEYAKQYCDLQIENYKALIELGEVDAAKEAIQAAYSLYPEYEMLRFYLDN